MRKILTITAFVCLQLFNVTSIQAQDYPENPWGGEWEHIFDDLNQTTRLQVNDKTNVLIINCDIHDVSGATNAIELNNCKKVLVINNTIRGHRYEGHGNAIQVRYGCEDVIIENNKIYDCDGTGISTAGSSAVCCPHDNPVPGCIIRGNLIHDVGKYPDPVGNSPKHGMYVKAQDVLIENNVVYNCFDGQGLSVRSTGTVRGNMVWNCKNWPFAYWPQKEGGPSDRLIIENNVFFQDGNYNGPLSNAGILIISSWDGLKFHNFVVRFNTLIRFPDAAHDLQMLNMATSTFNNVQVYGNVLVDLRTAGPIFFRGEEGCSYFDKNYTLTTDPGFVDMDNRDFHLAKTSLSINYAVGVNDFPDIDKDGVLRKAESLDAGAYEYDPGTFIQEINQKNQNLKIYPNPVAEGCIIKIDLNADINIGVKVVVYDMQGRILSNCDEYVQGGMLMLNMDKQIACGTYFIQIIGEGVNNVAKIYVE